ncbi:VOC family protein [Sphingomonas piscis]|uniref:VOC family protein n=1 Tax=Sphingomonas piscis TaxID=2714943 RepID=A0A6G7YQE4_9SPHN|nr:VOC family protein [Sphingomonas piscis]QIK78961.1 VOC family protein [Sphingomonas piscis]
MPNPHGTFIWYELMTPDAAGAKAFYDAVVGWDIDATSAAPMGYRMIKRSDGGNAGGLLPLTDEMQSQGARPVWIGYIGVDDVDASVAAIEGDGGTVMMPAWDVEGIGRMAMVTDAQGAPFYLMKPTPPAGQENAESDVFSVDLPQHIRWNELSTSDPAAAVDLYTRHFGWRQDGEMDMGELGKYQFLYHGDVMIGAVMPKMPQMPVSMWSFYIGVDDIDRAHEAVKAGGGQVFMEPMEIPGGEFSLNGMDPQGAAFGLVGPRKA